MAQCSNVKVAYFTNHISVFVKRQRVVENDAKAFQTVRWLDATSSDIKLQIRIHRTHGRSRSLWGSDITHCS